MALNKTIITLKICFLISMKRSLKVKSLIKKLLKRRFKVERWRCPIVEDSEAIEAEKLKDIQHRIT